MPIPTLTRLPPKPTFDDIVRKLNQFAGEYNQLLLNLDSLNVVSLTADHIDAGTLNAGLVTIRADLTGGAFITLDATNGLTINNGSFDTFEADINGDVTMTSATIRSLASGERVEVDSTGLHTYDAFGFERLTIGTAPVEGVKAITYRDVTGTAQGVMTYDTETVDGSSRTGQYITAHGSYYLLSNDGDLRTQNADGGGFRVVSINRPEINTAGAGWNGIAFKSEADNAQATATSALSAANNRGFSLSYDGANLSLIAFNGSTLSTVAVP